MERLTATQVTTALENSLGDGIQTGLARNGPASRVTGWIVYPGFQGVPRVNRQEWLWDGFDEEGTLPRWKGLRGIFGERASQIGMVFTFSPREYEQTFAEAA